MSKRSLKVLLSLVVIITLILSGCSSPANNNKADNKSGSNKVEPSKDEQKTLKLLRNNYDNELDEKLWADVLAEFKKLHPEISVELSTGDVSVETGKLTTLLQSGIKPPDAILIDSGPGRIRILSDVSLIQPLNDLYEENKWVDELDTYAYSKVIGNSGSDVIFEMPSIMHANTIYYNKEIFKKSGVEVPETWDEYMVALQKIKDAGYTPLTVGARNGYAIGWLFSNLLESVSGREAVENTFYTGGKWNDQPMVDTAQVLVDFVEKGFIPKESVTLTQQDSEFTFLGKESSATVVAGNNFINKVIDAKLEDHVGWFRMPSITDGKLTSPTGGIAKSWVIPTEAESPELAAIWFNFILGKEYSGVVLGNTANNMIPASKSAMEVPVANEMMGQLIKELDRDTAYNPTVYIGAETKEAYYQNLQGLIGGLVTAKQAMDNIEIGAEKDRAAGYVLTK